jgi:hypothetical protein
VKKPSGGVFLAVIGLFASAGTLLCCALPAFLVLLGFGAAVAGFVTQVPSLIWLSRNKVYVFTFAGIVLALAGWFRSRPEAKTCPPDPVKAKVCGRLKAFSGALFWISVVLYAAGFLVTFILPFFI